MTDSTPRVAMVAGETSGDLLAGLLLDGLKNVWPDVSAHGIGGAQMAQRGFAAWWPSEKLAVHGYSFEVLRRLREIIGIRKQLRTRLLADKPDVFIGVDAPDFNLGLEADLRAAGVKTVHFVCPSIWAWRAERIEKIRRSVDHVLCIFPFEPELLARHGIAATYVGHPLAAVQPANNWVWQTTPQCWRFFPAAAAPRCNTSLQGSFGLQPLYSVRYQLSK